MHCTFVWTTSGCVNYVRHAHNALIHFMFWSLSHDMTTENYWSFDGVDMNRMSLWDLPLSHWAYLISKNSKAVEDLNIVKMTPRETHRNKSSIKQREFKAGIDMSIVYFLLYKLINTILKMFPKIEMENKTIRSSPRRTRQFHCISEQPYRLIALFFLHFVRVAVYLYKNREHQACCGIHRAAHDIVSHIANTRHKAMCLECCTFFFSDEKRKKNVNARNVNARALYASHTHTQSAPVHGSSIPYGTGTCSGIPLHYCSQAKQGASPLHLYNLIMKLTALRITSATQHTWSASNSNVAQTLMLQKSIIAYDALGLMTLFEFVSSCDRQYAFPFK